MSHQVPNEQLSDSLFDLMSRQVTRRLEISKISGEVASGNGSGEDPSCLPTGHPVSRQ
ncbi:hypothetical protein HAX54_009583, partial [Datura stramonium]|nr:hypothetical protein [Datura stramonium]